MRILAAALLVALTVHTARADELDSDELHASAPRTVDFAGGLVIDAPFAPGVSSLPGVALEVRYFASGPLWLGVGASIETGADLRNPESGELVSLVATGVSIGVHQALFPRVEIFGGVRLDALRTEGWPMESASGAVFGVRAGPQTSLAVMLGRAWGHPMSIEARASWLSYRVGDSETSGWQTGLHLVGVLLPDRPSARSTFARRSL